MNPFHILYNWKFDYLLVKLRIKLKKQMQMKNLQAETALLPSEPQTHSQNRHWRQCILCQDYSLSQLQIQKFTTLREQVNVLFEKKQRWDLLRQLHLYYFQQQAQPEGSKQWLRLGFQGNRPETDLRGGGVMALQMILRFVKRRKELVQKMQADKGVFFFAITAINVAFLMKKCFHLAEGQKMDQDEYCNRRALKNFCRLLVDRNQAYMDLHEAFLSYFYNGIWLQAEEDNKSKLLRFNSLFQMLALKIRQTFEGGELFVFGDFQARWSLMS